MSSVSSYSKLKNPWGSISADNTRWVPQVNSKSKLCLPAESDGWTILLALTATVRQLSTESPCILLYSNAKTANLGKVVWSSKKEARERREVQFCYACDGYLLTPVHWNIEALFTEIRGSQLWKKKIMLKERMFASPPGWFSTVHFCVSEGRHW